MNKKIYRSAGSGVEAGLADGGLVLDTSTTGAGETAASVGAGEAQPRQNASKRTAKMAGTRMFPRNVNISHSSTNFRWLQLDGDGGRMVI